MNHTPGPWHINTLEVVPFSVHAARGCVAEVSKGTMLELSIDEMVANTNLIAAAPDLLATLKQTLRFLLDDTSIKEQVKAAINKAEGQL